MPDSTNPDIMTRGDLLIAIQRGMTAEIWKHDADLRSELERVTKERDELKRVPDGSHWTAIVNAASLIPDGDVMRLVNGVTSDFIRMRMSRDNVASELKRLKERNREIARLIRQHVTEIRLDICYAGTLLRLADDLEAGK